MQVGDNATLGAYVGVHQFTRVGPYAMIAAFVPLRKDVLPYSLVGGQPVKHYRLNTIGLRRRGITGERYRALEAAYRELREGRDVPDAPVTTDLELLKAWLAAPSKRGLLGFVASGPDED